MDLELSSHNEYWACEQELRTRTRQMTLKEQEDVRCMETHTWTREQSLNKYGEASEVEVCLGRTGSGVGCGGSRVVRCIGLVEPHSQAWSAQLVS